MLQWCMWLWWWWDDQNTSWRMSTGSRRRTQNHPQGELSTHICKAKHDDDKFTTNLTCILTSIFKSKLNWCYCDGFTCRLYMLMTFHVDDFTCSLLTKLRCLCYMLLKLHVDDFKLWLYMLMILDVDDFTCSWLYMLMTWWFYMLIDFTCWWLSIIIYIV
jgi:hypothetical protein